MSAGNIKEMVVTGGETASRIQCMHQGHSIDLFPIYKTEHCIYLALFHLS